MNHRGERGESSARLLYFPQTRKDAHALFDLPAGSVPLLFRSSEINLRVIAGMMQEGLGTDLPSDVYWQFDEHLKTLTVSSEISLINFVDAIVCVADKTRSKS